MSGNIHEEPASVVSKKHQWSLDAIRKHVVFLYWRQLPFCRNKSFYEATALSILADARGQDNGPMLDLAIRDANVVVLVNGDEVRIIKNRYGPPTPAGKSEFSSQGIAILSSLMDVPGKGY